MTIPVRAPLRPLFTADWPRYAVAAHVVFWVWSALFLAGLIGGFAKLVPGQIVGWLFCIEIVTALILGASAVCSGKLYAGRQVFARTPATGWPARIAGTFVVLGTAALILFAYGLSQVHGI